MASEVAEVQIELRYSQLKEEGFRKVQKVIAACKKLAKKYELEGLVSLVGTIHDIHDKKYLETLELK